MSRADADPARILRIFAWLFGPTWIKAWTARWRQAHPGAPRSRERCFTLRVTLWCLIWQRLRGGATLEEVVAYVRAGQVDRIHGGGGGRLSRRLRSLQTSAYNEARQRLPLELIRDAWKASCVRLVAWVLEASRRANRSPAEQRLRLWIDGSTLRVLANPKLSSRFPPARTRHGDTDWCLMRICVAFCCRCGAALHATLASQYVGEQAMAWQLMLHAQAGTIWIGDRNFGVWSVAAQATHGRQDVLVRLSRDRAKALAKSVRGVCRADQLLCWLPARRVQIPAGCENTRVTGRLIQVCVFRGHRAIRLWLFTTLLDPTLYPVDLLIRWYGERWGAELNLRSFKTHLGMETLVVASPDMVEKEFHAGILAYNLVRVLMWQREPTDPDTLPPLSFGLCCAQILQWMERWSRWPTFRILSIPRELRQLRRELARCRLPRRRRPRPPYARIVRHRPPSKFAGFSGNRALAHRKQARLAAQRHRGTQRPLSKDA